MASPVPSSGVVTASPRASGTITSEELLAVAEVDDPRRAVVEPVEVPAVVRSGEDEPVLVVESDPVKRVLIDALLKYKRPALKSLFFVIGLVS
jgi:hypothetical protein